VDMPDSLDRPTAALKPTASKPAAPVGAGSGEAAAKRRNPLASLEPAQKRKRVEPAARACFHPR
jgi:hypothetical protein